jgi:hypothetical protein
MQQDDVTTVESLLSDISSSPSVAAGPRLIFVHSPKTAGMALYEALQQWASPERSLRYAVGGPEDWDRHRRLTDAEIAHLRLVSGHVDFSAFADDPRFDDWLVITVLREPVRRVLSLYAYVKGWAGHPWHEQLAGADIDEFVTFLSADPYNIDSQCKMIAGTADARVAFELLSHRFFLAASVEDLDEMIEILNRRLGVELAVGRVNESPTRIDAADVAPTTLARIARMNVQDSDLYSRVLKLGVVGTGAPSSRKWIGYAKSARPSSRRG